MKYSKKDMIVVNAIRALSMDQITHANTGHTGITLSAAPLVYVIYKNMKIDSSDPKWFNRDRFILSGGHGSAMLYATLHLNGYDISIDDLKKFRTLGSKTPGHPEVTTPGVDATTGPLGQGFGMSVGMAMAEKHLSALYNKPSYPVVDNKIYVEVGDGDLMEGISHESASLAGHLHLNNLIVLYDSNNNTMDASMKQECDDNVAERFKAYGWNYIRVDDGNDLNAIDSAVQVAKDEKDRPTLIEVKTILGYDSPLADSHKAHGTVLTEEQVKETKKNLGYNHQPFDVPQEAYDAFKETQSNGKTEHEKWNQLIKDYADRYPELGKKFVENTNNIFKLNVDQLNLDIPDAEATRNAIHQVLQATAKTDLNLWGGSADLGSSDKTYFDDDQGFQPTSYENKNLYFGIREFAEGTAINGISLYGGSRVFGNTFFIFSDYMKSALRHSALMKVPSIFLFGHDSISLGPDGPTHQPIEQLEGLRAMPDINVFRPADILETMYAWEYTINEHNKPAVFALGRQSLPTLKEYREAVKAGVPKGGYILTEASNCKPEGILMATGSEVTLVLQAQRKLEEKGIYVRVVSMPCFELFLDQSKEYQDEVLPFNLRNRLSVEMATTYDWNQFVGLDGITIGINHFGESGNGDKLIEKSGFTVQNIVDSYVNKFSK